MVWFQKHWKTLLVPLLIGAVLAGLFLCGGGMDAHDRAAEPTAAPEQTVPSVSGEPALPRETTPGTLPEGQAEAEEKAPVQPEAAPLPAAPEDNAYTCTLSVSCAVLLEYLEELSPEKAELVPSDGWILAPTEVTFYEGESVFQVLQRTCKQLEIHLEFENTPVYQSAYIEGIHNLYELDCGALSGWMYCVNGWFPNYGCSRYLLQQGDVVEWRYTCDLGADIGGNNAVEGA